MLLILRELKEGDRHPKNEFDLHPVACAINTRVYANRIFLGFSGIMWDRELDHDF